MSSNSEFLQADKYNKRPEGEMRGKWQDLPDEIILKFLSYLEVKDLISCGQLSKRTRNISQDRSLWVTANLEKKIVKTELLEMILLKGCKILNLSNSTIVGHLRRNMITQLRVLDLSYFGWGFPLAQRLSTQVYYEENMSKIEGLLSSCCSLQNLKMEGLRITSKMAASICLNGTTLQVLNLSHSFVEDVLFDRLTHLVPNIDLLSIIQSCQELKELDLNDTNVPNDDNEVKGLLDNDFDVLAKIISPNVERLNLSKQYFEDENVKHMLSRCNKIKVLTLEATLITNDSLKTIRQCLNLTLEELTLAYFAEFHLCLLELKTMARLKILNLYNRYKNSPYKKTEDKKVQDLRQQLPHLTIRTFFDY